MDTKFHKDILEKNSRIDRLLVQRHDNLEKELKKLGVDTSTKFRLSPPLGSNNLLLYNK